MENLKLLIEALDVLDLSFEECEIRVGLEKNTIVKAIKNKQELSDEDYANLARTYGEQFKLVGYIFIFGKEFNKPSLILIKKDFIPHGTNIYLI